MNNKDKERITLMFIEIAKEARRFFASEDSAVYSDLLLVSGFDEEIESMLVHLLEDFQFAAKFSEEYLGKLLKEKIRAMLRSLRQQEYPRIPPNKIARRTAEAIFHELDSYTTMQTVYLPVSGMSLQVEEEKLEVGNVTFQKMTQEEIDKIVGHVSSAIMALSNTLEYKQGFIRVFTEDLQEVFSDTESQTYAIYQVVAEPIRARERAIEECYQVFDLLRYALPMLSDLFPMEFSIPMKYLDATQRETNKYVKRKKRAEKELGRFVAFGLQGEVGTNTARHEIILSDSPGFSWSTDRSERFTRLELSPQDVDEMTRIGVFEVAEIIKKGEEVRTNFEQTILRSVHWFANAQTPMQPGYIILSLMSSIEAFLNPPGEHEQVTTAIIEGVAALGGAQGYTYTKNRIEELYDKRSRLSHGDRTEIMMRDIAELRQIAFYMIKLMINSREDFTTQEQVYEQIKKIRGDIKQSIARNSSNKAQ